MTIEGSSNPSPLPPLPIGWRVAAIDDLCEDVTSGGTPLRSNAEFFVGGRHDWFKTGELKDSVLFGAAEKITDEALNQSSAKLFPTNTVLMAMYGDGDTITSLGLLGREAATNQACCAMIPNRAVCEPRFLFYALRFHRRDFIRLATGGAQRNLSGKLIRRFALNVPPLSEQRAIAHILGTLDDKIELNRRMNETLEAMARALFKSWFAEIDAVRAETAALIRDRVLEIGDGYRAKNSELGETGLPFIRAGNLNNGFDTIGADILCEESTKKAGNKVCRVGDVAFTSKGTIGRFARVTEHTARFVYSPQVCYWRSLDPLRLHPALLYCWMQSEDLGEQIAAVAGQTDMALYVSLQDQRQMSMPVFPQSQHTLARYIEPLLIRQAFNTAEMKTLTALRDTLLPKLISGELRVNGNKCTLGQAC